ncbi:MAG: hypothetical protein MUC66_03005 [Methanolinea sp.]|jgi:protein phosphatase|nr:hypothetical protein [Methanolinea sp.]
MSPFEYCAFTEKGLRERNEDACLAREVCGIYLFAVAEGLGGPVEGPSAAEVAIHALCVEGIECSGTLAEIVEAFLIQADEALFISQQSNPGSDPPAVAMTLAVVRPGGECVVSSPGHRKVFFMPRDPVQRNGMESTEDSRSFDLYDPGAGMHEAALPPGFLVLCSDGIGDFLENARIREIISERGDDLEGACRKMVYESFQNGSDDNLTVVLVRQPGP